MKPSLVFHRAAAPPLAVVCLLGLLAAFPQPAAAQTQQLDFGDAPPPYPTTLKDNGARHTLAGPQLGLLRDAETDGIPDSFALGDDHTQDADEDGVQFVTALVPGQAAKIQVTVNGAPNGARLDAWMDFDSNGSWSELADHILASVFVNNGANVLSFQVPATAKLGPTFARFRLSTLGDLNFTGAAADGEVEDYYVGISATMDFGDAPTGFSTFGGFNYPTLLSQNGARHRVVPNFMLGTRIDGEPDGQPDPTASADKDDDGVTFTSGLAAGATATVEVVCTMDPKQTGRLNAWMDFNQDSDWGGPGEQIFQDVSVVNGTNKLTFAVPASALGGLTFARFRLNAEGKLGPRGFASEGEVEDYQVSVTAGLDFGDAPDAPYPTFLKNNGARHTVDKSFCLGTQVDSEADGQPNADATGDPDDDGVTFTSSLLPGTMASVKVYVTAPVGANGGILNAWLDFNRNGTWADQAEQIFANVPVVPGVNNLTFSVPATAATGATFARFRLSTARGLSFTGPAQDGEVEDYQVNVSTNQLDYGDAPRPYPTLLVVDGARHVYNPDIFLGKSLDAEPDGQPDLNALADPDDDGVVFTTLLVPGAPATVQVTASTTGFLHAWIDFNANGSWADPGEKIFDTLLIAPGANSLAFMVPANATGGKTFARFRFTTLQSPLDFVGLAPNGEVEDYQVAITPDRDRCDLDCEGREFWLTFPGNYAPDPDNPAQLSLCVHGVSGTTVKITVDGIGFGTNVVIPASQATLVPLPRGAELGDLNDVVTNLGIHVVASAPVGVQAFDHARYTSDSYLGLHASVVGTTYVVMGYGNVHSGVPPLNGSQFALVATESNTIVQITPTVDTQGHLAGVPYNLVLNQPGDAYQLRNTNNAPADLSGTIIRADKPIAVFGSHRNTTIPNGNVWFQDYVVEQLLSVNTWGNDFYTAPLATRSGGDTFRILAAYDGTDVYLNGAYFVTLNRGKFYQTTLLTGARITSTRPVFVAQYANSGDYDGNTNADPFMLTVQATRHYASSYRVCTAPNDFATNFICVIAPSGIIGSIQIDGAAIPGPFVAIGATGYTYARALVAPGNHRVTGNGGFACYVYGWAEYDSYAHPACFYFGDVQPPRLSTAAGTVTATVNDYMNTPGLVPIPSVASTVPPQDNCSGEFPTPTQNPPPGTLVLPGLYTLTLSVADADGNIGETNVVFTVLDPSPVIIDCPQDIVVNCSSNGGTVVNFTVTAHSTYDPAVPVVSTPPSGSFFPGGTTVVTNVATSLAGLSNTCTFNVTVICDTQLNVVRGADTLTFSWSGLATLETADDPGGPWRPLVSGVSGYAVPITGKSAFFRVHY